MANPEHTAILQRGIEVWNRWRHEHPEIQPDLRAAPLNQAHLRGADLIRTDLTGAHLRGADLREAKLAEAILIRADLSLANLRAADLFAAKISDAILIRVDLSREPYVDGMMLGGLSLLEADLSRANLSGANLRSANLCNANLSGTYLNGADLSRATAGWTIFADIDLSVANGLETINHKGPSTIGIDTIYRSRGKLPEVFLRRAGVPDNFIAYIGSLVGKPIEFYSCFISYSNKDQRFAERLFIDLQGKGVRCWYAPEHLKVGAKTRPTIDETIRLHDKLLLVLSKHSVASDWVEQEVETALARERRDKQPVLFPIRVDKSITVEQSGWPALIWNTRNVGDFTRWKNDDAYRRAFDRLLRDLRDEARKP